MLAALYARVSTQDQDHAMQLFEMREFAKRMGWSVVEYAEKVSSVKVRPIFNAMMQDARHRRFDIVICWKLDRFSRSLRQLAESIAALDSYGIRFICATQGIDTDKNNATSRLILNVMGAVAEFERAMIVERVTAGVRNAQRKGVHCGRPKRIFRRDEAVALRAMGFSLRAIAKKLGVPLSTVADALKK